jgi:hypothetical protein
MRKQRRNRNYEPVAMGKSNCRRWGEMIDVGQAVIDCLSSEPGTCTAEVVEDTAAGSVVRAESQGTDAALLAERGKRPKTLRRSKSDSLKFRRTVRLRLTREGQDVLGQTDVPAKVRVTIKTADGKEEWTWSQPLGTLQRLRQTQRPGAPGASANRP